MSALESVLERFRQESSNELEKGKRFEKLVRIFLKNDMAYKDKFKDVEFYSNWAKKHGKPRSDIGIDLVAANKDDDKFTAIQCKFYDNTAISKKAIDSFFSAAADKDFTHLILVDTAREGLGPNALKILKNPTKPFKRIGMDALKSSRIDWNSYIEGNDKINIKKEDRGLRPYQQEALKAVEKGFERTDRGKLIMACGTGKTITSLRIAENQAGKGKLVLYLVPSLALLAQTIREWVNDTNTGINAYATCSDPTVGNRKADDDSLAMDLYDLSCEASTKPEILAREFIMKPDSMNVIFTTYHSVGTISKAQEYGVPEIDLIICDEAHRTTGAKVKGGKDESHFMKIHSYDNVQGKKRLYMTATPKIYSENVKEKAEEKDAISFFYSIIAPPSAYMNLTYLNKSFKLYQSSSYDFFF